MRGQSLLKPGATAFRWREDLRLTAKKVADFVKEHADDIPKWLGSADELKDKLPGGLGKMF